MSDKTLQGKPDNISEERWEEHMHWMQVTGTTTDKHLEEHRKGNLWREYRNGPQP
ncbi:MAG: hypothetical protein R3296_03305 [Oleiphilaceae bacterium]|nr:hypothetical protein [Oleiphilaceae bacterium]